MANSGMFEFKNRSEGANEIIDSPDLSAGVAGDSYSFMEEVNRFYGGGAAIKSFLHSETQRNRFPARPLQILDLGSGSCDIPLMIVNWCKQQGFAVHYTCLEQNRIARKLARWKNLPGQIDLKNEDLLTYEPQQKYDYITASMVMHHFTFEQIKFITARYIKYTRRALVINDLRRHRVFYWLTWLRTLVTSPENRHDALLSVKKGFSRVDFQRLENKLPGIEINTKTVPLFRIRATVRAER